MAAAVSTCWLTKIVITSAYCGTCACKLYHSFGVPIPFSYVLQRLHVLCPKILLMPASIGALAFQTLAPLMLLAPAQYTSVPFALSGLVVRYHHRCDERS